MTIGEMISRIRTSPKIQNVDALITNRHVYNMMVTARDVLIKNEDDKKALMKMSFLFKPLNYVELIEIDTIEACGIDSDCTLMRTKDKLPEMLKAQFGNIIKDVTSIDGEISLNPLLSRRAFTNRLSSPDLKFDKSFYYYIEGDYMYFPNITWDAVKIYAFWEDPDLIDSLNDCDDSQSLCVPKKDKEFLSPNYLNQPIIDKSIDELLRVYHPVREDSLMNKNTTS